VHRRKVSLIPARPSHGHKRTATPVTALGSSRDFPVKTIFHTAVAYKHLRCGASSRVPAGALKRDGVLAYGRNGAQGQELEQRRGHDVGAGGGGDVQRGEGERGYMGTSVAREEELGYLEWDATGEIEKSAGSTVVTCVAKTEFMSFMEGCVMFKRRLQTAAASALCKHKMASLCD
jgi:hypothetical protein